ncbi:hypothetical protein M0813_18853 [Anaeramoeba flamelloides]|uniref:Uncharacterized protein n=1 Tax=Anaeramoeba flamelloides TaxID=1746091 RepID=A0ABQ8YRQ7_9EUKA|nr:hypothetical protein M0813_18853 [Anaeramoeba flamelloides]
MSLLLIYSIISFFFPVLVLIFTHKSIGDQLFHLVCLVFLCSELFSLTFYPLTLYVKKLKPIVSPSFMILRYAICFLIFYYFGIPETIYDLHLIYLQLFMYIVFAVFSIQFVRTAMYFSRYLVYSDSIKKKHSHLICWIIAIFCSLFTLFFGIKFTYQAATRLFGIFILVIFVAAILFLIFYQKSILSDCASVAFIFTLFIVMGYYSQFSNSTLITQTPSPSQSTPTPTTTTTTTNENFETNFEPVQEMDYQNGFENTEFPIWFYFVVLVSSLFTIFSSIFDISLLKDEKYSFRAHMNNGYNEDYDDNDRFLAIKKLFNSRLVGIKRILGILCWISSVSYLLLDQTTQLDPKFYYSTATLSLGTFIYLSFNYY